MMERFAEKYCADNPQGDSLLGGKSFTAFNADCCYVLAFSLIMLQTDLHSTQIKNKMTVDEFVSNNRGINGGADLPKPYLTALYGNINARPITLSEDEDARAKLEGASANNAIAKMELFFKEISLMIARGSKMLQEARDKPKRAPEEKFILSNELVPAKVGGVLFEAISWPLLATLSVLLERLGGGDTL